MVKSFEFFDFLKSLKFLNVGSWKLLHNELNYSIDIQLETSVYIWVAETKDSKIIPLYIGKAGSTLKKRMYEHLRGFKGNSKSGQKKGEVLKLLLDQKISIQIYARESLTFDSTKISAIDYLFPNCKFNTPLSLSTESLEEKVLIELIKSRYKKTLPLNYMSDKTKNEIETNYQNFVIN